jgi:hypothetical protein
MTGVLDGQTATAAFAVATGVIGASARILRSLPDQDDVAADQRGARNGQADKNLVVTAPEVSKGRAGKSSQDGQ